MHDPQPRWVDPNDLKEDEPHIGPKTDDKSDEETEDSESLSDD